MFRQFKRGAAAGAAIVAGLAVLVGCADTSPTGFDTAATEIEPLRSNMPPNAQLNAALATLRRVTAAYHRHDRALADGYVPIAGCLAAPGMGGVGVPHAKLAIVDGTLDITEPEVLLYEPQRNGKMRLVAVEQVIPFELWTEASPPDFFGHEFHPEPVFGLFGIHIWVWRHNPDGMFARVNPRVTCEFAD